jgi:NADH dehydrogenase
VAERPFRFELADRAAVDHRGREVGALLDEHGRIRLSGRVAWLLWGLVHIYFLIGFRNRLVVSLNWLWAYLTFERGSRLITGPTP